MYIQTTPRAYRVEIADQLVATLASLVDELGVTSEDLDEGVYHCSGHHASKLWGNYYPEDMEDFQVDDDGFVDEDEYFDWLMGQTDSIASDVNNGGVESQLAFILWYLEENLTEAMDLLRGLADRKRPAS